MRYSSSAFGRETCFVENVRSFLETDAGASRKALKGRGCADSRKDLTLELDSHRAKDPSFDD
jgi:hypothetical protein